MGRRYAETTQNLIKSKIGATQKKKQNLVTSKAIFFVYVCVES